MRDNFETQDGCLIGATFFTVVVTILLGVALNIVVIWAIIKAVLHFT